MLSPRMAYVLLWFPLSSETFVFREIQQLVQRGMDIRVYTMYGEKLRGCSDEMKNYAGPIKRFGSVATLRLLKEGVSCMDVPIPVARVRAVACLSVLFDRVPPEFRPVTS